MGPPSPTGTVENAGCVASTRSATVTSARRPEIGITISRAVSSWLSLVCPTPVSAAAEGRRPHAELGGADLDDLTLRAWRRHRQTVLLQPGNVKLDGLADQPQHLRRGFAYGYTPWEVRHVGSPTRRSPFHHDHIARHSPLPAFLRPACFRIVFSVPGRTSKLGFPTTVTVPGCSGSCIGGGCRASSPSATHLPRAAGSVRRPSFTPRCQRSLSA